MELKERTKQLKLKVFEGGIGSITEGEYQGVITMLVARDERQG